MWINLKKYVGQEFEIQKHLISFLSVKREVIKKHDKDVGVPVWLVAIGTAGLPAPILITCNTEDEALKVKNEIKNA